MLMDRIERLDIETAALRKWSMPVLHAVGRDAARFGELRRRLQPVTDRALTLALKDLVDAGLLERRVYDDYPPTTAYRLTRRALPLLEPLAVTETSESYDIDATIHGGGTTGQAGALRLGIARGLVELDAEHRGALKSAGFLTRDPRKKESKKYGLKKARKAPQYSKR